MVPLLQLSASPATYQQFVAGFHTAQDSSHSHRQQQQQQSALSCSASAVVGGGGGCVSRAQRSSRAKHVRASAALQLMARAYCPPRSGRLQACASRSKTRRRRSGSSGGGDDDDSGDNMWGADWPFDAWSSSSSLFYGGSGGNNNFGGGGSGGSGGWGHHGWDSAAGGDAFHQAVYHATWLWQLLCGASLLRSLYFLLFTESAAAQAVEAASAAAGLPRIALAC